MKISNISQKLIEKKIKVTPQRLTIFDAIVKLNNHPTAEIIYEYIKKSNPNISFATVYKVLNVLINEGLVLRVTTDKDKMRYEAKDISHHHIYCTDTEQIIDYIDSEISNVLKNYFEQNQISGFEIEDIKLQINGKFFTNNK